MNNVAPVVPQVPTKATFSVVIKNVASDVTPPEDVIKDVPDLHIKKTWRSSPRRRTNQFTYLIRLSTDDKDPPTDVARSKTQVL